MAEQTRGPHQTSLKSGALAWREAVAGDSDWVYSVNNHPSVRAQSLSPEPIPPEDHARWFPGVLADRDRFLWIGSEADADVGVVRFDIDRTIAVISIALTPSARGRGLGTALIIGASTEVFERRPDVESVRAHVRASNLASRAAFEKSGFTAEVVDAEVLEMVLYRSARTVRVS